jgi:hypothetical protein
MEGIGRRQQAIETRDGSEEENLELEGEVAVERRRAYHSSPFTPCKSNQSGLMGAQIKGRKGNLVRAAVALTSIALPKPMST